MRRGSFPPCPPPYSRYFEGRFPKKPEIRKPPETACMEGRHVLSPEKPAPERKRGRGGRSQKQIRWVAQGFPRAPAAPRMRALGRYTPGPAAGRANRSG